MPHRRRQRQHLEISRPIAMETLSSPPPVTTKPSALPPLRPPRSPRRMSGISSVSDWGRSTLNICMGTVTPQRFSWLRIEEDEIKQDDKRRWGLHGREGIGKAVLTTVSSEPESINVLDPNDPKGWKKSKKWLHVALLSWMSFSAPLCSLILAPAAPAMAKDLNVDSRILSTLAVSIYTLGYILGPLVFAPLSEIYGRLPILHFSNVCLTVFVLACGFSQTYQQLIAFRALSGALGSASITMGSSVIIDLFELRDMARPMASWALGPLVAPFAGAIVGGITASELSWRWVFYIQGAISGVLTLVCFAFMRETSLRVIRKQQPSRSESTNVTIQPAVDPKRVFNAAAEPLHLIFQNPIITLNALYIGMLYGTLYLISIHLPFATRKRYGFDELKTGLAYNSINIGILLGLPITGLLNRQWNADITPEDRLPGFKLVLGNLWMAGGLVMYGWTAETGQHWIVPLLGLLVYSIGLVPMTLLVQTYLIDAFRRQAKSTMALLVIVRALTTSLLPLSGHAIYDKFQFGGGNTLLAGIVLLLAVIPLTSKLLGESTRIRFKLDMRRTRPPSTIYGGLG